MPSFFPIWMIVTHFLNIFFLLLLARSGLEVLAAHPKLYWSDDCPPARPWARFSKKVYAPDSRRLWTSHDEEEAWSPVIALPGRRNLGLGRHWHFMTVQFWVLTGAVYLALVFTTGHWRYLVPTSWSLFPDSVKTVGTYLQFRLAGPLPVEPFNAAQKLSYFVVVFLLAPFQILTGAAMSPSVIARFPRYTRLFGGRQKARSLHFLGLVAFAAFTVVHTAMVIVHGLPREFAAMVLGSYDADRRLGLAIGLLGLLLLVAFHVVITRFSLHHRRRTQHLLGLMVNPFERRISRGFTSRQHYSRRDISPYFRVNGYPPVGEDYQRLAADGFRDYRLSIGGLVEHPVTLGLDELRRLGNQSEITKHNCIQGWTAVAQWAGVPLARVLDLVKPLPDARHAVFYAFDDKARTEGSSGVYYESVPLYLLTKPQAILALDMNDAPLSIEHGAPVRIRLETQLGFKMVKWVSAVEFVADYRQIGMGQGGWREDNQFYANEAGI
ncbi:MULTISPECIES: molybdopterin-dependent oxidoreductase [Micromonospora]|nr:MULTISPECIES: molybdopterin-dependent oxidoreductase [Micromonospora]